MAETKIGYVDLIKVVNLSVAGKVTKERLLAEVKENHALVESRHEELKKLKEELKELPKAIRPKKERDYQKKLKEFMRFTKGIQKKSQQQDADFTRRILKELTQVIKEVGEKENFTLVIKKTKSSILFTDGQIDLTDKVIKAYDAKQTGLNGPKDHQNEKQT